MLSAVSDKVFQLPRTRHSYRPKGLCGPELHRLIARGRETAASSSPELRRVLDRIVELRGQNVTWCFGLSLREVLAPIPSALGGGLSLVAPLTIFKIRLGIWVPKVVIRVAGDSICGADELSLYHEACRRASVEFMCISDDHIYSGYLDSKDFKRAFNGAFFCEESSNSTIFCPTLRDLGFYTWERPNSDHESQVARS